MPDGGQSKKEFAQIKYFGKITDDVLALDSAKSISGILYYESLSVNSIRKYLSPDPVILTKFGYKIQTRAENASPALNIWKWGVWVQTDGNLHFPVLRNLGLIPNDHRDIWTISEWQIRRYIDRRFLPQDFFKLDHSVTAVETMLKETAVSVNPERR